MSSLEIAKDYDHEAQPNDNENDNDDRQLLSINQRHQSDREQRKLHHWKESEYATGLVEPTWTDEWDVYREKRCCDWGCGCVYPSAVVGTCLGAGRIGNMAVLKERYVIVDADDDDNDDSLIREWGDCFVREEEGESSLQSNNNNSNTTTATATNPKQPVRRRDIQLIVGPFWPLLIFITYPLILGMSAFTLYSGIPGKPLGIQVLWALLTLQLIRSLFNTGFRDPGIVRRRTSPPPVRENNRYGKRSGSWIWDDRVQSYRPKNSIYCIDCKVVVEEFDHT